MDNNQMQNNQVNNYQPDPYQGGNYQSNNYQPNNYQGGYQPNNYQNYNNMGQPAIPEEYRPISPWGYVGYQLLFSIPCIGIILLLVFAFGGTKNINLKNWTRSYLCILLIVAILLAIVTLLGGAGFLAAFSQYANQY